MCDARGATSYEHRILVRGVSARPARSGEALHPKSVDRVADILSPDPELRDHEPQEKDDSSAYTPVFYLVSWYV